MEKYVDCHNCQNQYDCERTYLGGCTDGKEWEQEEKKLTDEEIVKALEHCATENTCRGCVKHNGETTIDYFKCMRDTRKNVVDLINRQKAEIERLTSLYDGKSGFMTSSIGDLPLNVAGLRKAVDEISRLLVVQGELQDLNIKYYNDAKDLRRENAKIQKQVEQLTIRIAIRENDIGKLESEVDDLKTDLQQAVKETAKEIFTKVDNAFSLYYPHGQIPYSVFQERLKRLAKEKGVEVE